MANLDSSSLLLSIYLEQDGRWEFVDNLQFVGPMAERTVAVPLNFSPGTSDINIKLNCGYRFWELNKVSMSFDTDRLPPEDIHYPEMVEVPDDIRDKLSEVDGQYFIQKKTGDFIDLSWQTGNTTQSDAPSIFLECAGYYIPKTRRKGKPDIAQLEKFREPGYFSVYSYSKYRQATDIPATIVEAEPPTVFK
jgi:hypothetical protein